MTKGLAALSLSAGAGWGGSDRAKQHCWASTLRRPSERGMPHEGFHYVSILRRGIFTASFCKCRSWDSGRVRNCPGTHRAGLQTQPCPPLWMKSFPYVSSGRTEDNTSLWSALCGIMKSLNVRITATCWQIADWPRAGLLDSASLTLLSSEGPRFPRIRKSSHAPMWQWSSVHVAPGSGSQFQDPMCHLGRKDFNTSSLRWPGFPFPCFEVWSHGWSSWSRVHMAESVLAPQDWCFDTRY